MDAWRVKLGDVVCDLLVPKNPIRVFNHLLVTFLEESHVVKGMSTLAKVA